MRIVRIKKFVLILQQNDDKIKSNQANKCGICRFLGDFLQIFKNLQ